MRFFRNIVTAALAVSIAFAGSVSAAEKWMTGDIHQHSYFTDGSWTINDLDSAGNPMLTPVEHPSKQGVMPTGYRNGLDFQANSEHGGVRERDGFGIKWSNTAKYPTNPAIGDPASGQMWRWQSLIRSIDIPGYSGPAYLGAYDWLEGVRAAYPEKLTMSGMEWNPPGHEHCTTGILADTAMPVAEFEYRFDKSDTDGTTTTTTANTMGWFGKKQNSAYVAPAYPDYSAVLGLSPAHEKTLDAVKWMQQNHPWTGWIIPAHVERAGCGVNAWSIASLRDINNFGPSVAFGFEGIPGHEKSSNRGEFGSGSCGGGTYGGAGLYVAQVGGVWDNLLADGRKYFNFASSDFHNNSGADFWPGEYLKMYVKVKDSGGDGIFREQDVLNGLRSGNSFAVHGDLINDLDFSVMFKSPYGSRSATMGETLSVKKGNKVTVQIRFKTPPTNNCAPGVNASASYVCKAPLVHHVQLIQGRINPTRAAKLLDDGSPNPAYNAVDPTVATVVKTFDASSWSVDAEGYTTMAFVVPNVQNDLFFRIRGTNVGYGVAVKNAGNQIIYGTDAAGNPLRNTPGTNNADYAWDDLWFYSNPIFIKAM